MLHPGVVKKTVPSTVPHKDSLPGDLVKPVDALENTETMKHNSKFIFGVYGLLILLGIGTGYMLSRGSSSVTTSSGNSVVKSGNTVGSTDVTTFKTLLRE